MGTGKTLILQEKAIELELLRKQKENENSRINPIVVITTPANAKRFRDEFSKYKFDLSEIQIYVFKTESLWEIIQVPADSTNVIEIGSEKFNNVLSNSHVFFDEFQEAVFNSSTIFEIAKSLIKSLSIERTTYLWISMGPIMLHVLSSISDDDNSSRKKLMNRLENEFKFKKSVLTIMLRYTITVSTALKDDLKFKYKNLYIDKPPNPQLILLESNYIPEMISACCTSYALQKFESSLAKLIDDCGKISEIDWVITGSSLQERIYEILSRKVRI